MIVSAIPLADADAAAVDAICALKMQHWPHPMPAQRSWWASHGEPDDILVRLVDGAELKAFLRLRSRAVVSGGAAIDAFCATEVCVTKSSQGSGLGRNLMMAASGLIEGGKKRIGYLLCREEQKGFYARCGWSLFDGPVSIRSSAGSERAPAPDERCFVFDPHRLLGENLVLIGDVF